MARRAHSGTIRIGISGWRYGGWRGVFYPEKLPQRQELSYAAQRMSSIEINGTFYSMQRPSSFAEWKAQTPPDFLFSVKGSRYLTHMLKLNNPLPGLANFFAQGVLALGEKLGPILWQLPPGLAFHPEKLQNFLEVLPRTGEEAAELARAHHDHRLKGQPWLDWSGVGALRYAMEVRHSAFCCTEYINLLRQSNVASVVSDSAGRFPVIDDVTADFIYVRLHGHEHLYSGGYGDDLLRTWADRIRAWSSGEQIPTENITHPDSKLPRHPRDVFIYFDNDAKVDAPRDAMRLEELIAREI